MTASLPVARPARQRHGPGQPGHPARPGLRRAGPARARAALPPRVRGLGSVAMVIVLVAMATLAAAVMRLGVQGATSAEQDLLAGRASAAARSGLEWGLYQALKGSWTACASASQTLDLRTDTGMRVTVSCDLKTYYEGETAPGTPATLRVYTLEAVACNGSAATCPDAAAVARQGYVERKVQSLAVN